MTTPISRDELGHAIEGGRVTVVDALPAAYFSERHLPGAVNLVEADVEAYAAALLPDKQAAIVTYCSNTACGNSRSVASALKRLGYTDVRTYPEGIQDWVESGLPVQVGAARSADEPTATA